MSTRTREKRRRRKALRRWHRRRAWDAIVRTALASIFESFERDMDEALVRDAAFVGPALRDVLLEGRA